MVDETTAERRLPAFMQSPIFWIGFGVSIFGILWNIVSYFNPTFPVILWRQGVISFGREFKPIRMNLYWPIIGFAYFIKLDVGFSIWLFYLLGVIEEGLFNRIGLEVKTPDPYGTGFGTAQFSGAIMTALGMSYRWYGDMKTTLMPALGHSVVLEAARLFSRGVHFFWG